MYLLGGGKLQKFTLLEIIDWQSKLLKAYMRMVSTAFPKIASIFFTLATKEIENYWILLNSHIK